MNAPFRPPSAPRRYEVLAFVIERIARDGVCPTLQEIADALSPPVSQPRARELVDQLVKDGKLERTVGLQRNLRVRDVASCRVTLIEVLRRFGLTAAEPMGDLAGPLPNVQLPMLPPFEHLPDLD